MVDVLYAAARLFAFAALALLIGVALFLAAWWPGGARHPVTRRLLWSGWAVLVGSTVSILLLFGPQVAQRPLSSVADSGLLSVTLDTRMGTAMLLRLLVLSLAAPALALLLSRREVAGRRERRWRIGGVLAGAVLLGITWSIAGHSAMGTQAVIAVPVDVSHLVAMGVWLGGLVVLCGVLLRTDEVAAMRTAVPLFSRAALVCVVVLVVTGIYQGWRQVGSPTALTTTSYGWLLLGKVALVIVLVGVGAASRSWVRRHYTGIAPAGSSISAKRAARRGPARLEVTRFRRTVAAEVGLAAVVLGVTAALVSSQPARAAQLAATAREQVAQQVAQQRAALSAEPWPTPDTARIAFDSGGPAGQGTVDATVFPAAVGDNQIHISIFDPASRLLDVSELTAMLNIPGRSVEPVAVQMQKLAPGHYLGTVPIPTAGTWQLTFTVQTSEADHDVITMPIEVR